MHCASAGEFEQGKPILEQLKSRYPAHKILVSFFSPSGYAVAKNDAHADIISYIPIDTANNAKKFIRLVQPEIAFFIKYEFWYHLIRQANKKKIPILLASAVFRQDQVFFRPYGKTFKNMLSRFTQLFVQDTASLDLLNENGIRHAQVSGDTRFDRVSSLVASPVALPLIETFANGQPLLVAGSTWMDDEKLLAKINGLHHDFKLIIAPHEIHEAHIKQIEKLFKGAVKYSLAKRIAAEENQLKGMWAGVNNEEQLALQKQLQNARVLIIDNVGMLSKLYYYATVTYVGGGFTKDGIHNVLEPAAFGKPVCFGPNYQKYREAIELIETGGGFSIKDAASMENLLAKLKEGHLQRAAKAAKDYISDNEGATEKILHYIQENRLLTSW
jgi:3-deoxy-D-manno-octulosonic-acid transferase